MPVFSSVDTDRLDPWTIGAIAVVAYALSNVVHEGLAVFFQGDEDGLPASAGRWVAAGGSLANLVVAALAWAALRVVPAGWGRAGVPLGVPRSAGWLITAALMLVLFVGVLGPGVALGAAR